LPPPLFFPPESEVSNILKGITATISSKNQPSMYYLEISLILMIGKSLRGASYALIKFTIMSIKKKTSMMRSRMS